MRRPRQIGCSAHAPAQLPGDMPRTRAQRRQNTHERVSEPLADALSLLAPRALARLGSTCRLWKNAAGRAGLPFHVYSISLRYVDITHRQEVVDETLYEATTAAPPFETNRGFSGGVLELALLSPYLSTDDGAREYDSDADSDCEEVWYHAVTVTCSSPALVETIDKFIAHFQATDVLLEDLAPCTGDGYVSFDAKNDLRWQPNRLARLPRAFDVIPIDLLRNISRLYLQNLPAGRENDVLHEWPSLALGESERGDGYLRLDDVKERLRVTQFGFEAPSPDIPPRFDSLFYRILRESGETFLENLMGDTFSESPCLAAREAYCQRLNRSILPHFMRMELFHEVHPWLDPDEPHDSELLNDAEFTVELLDRNRTRRLNILFQCHFGIGDLTSSWPLDADDPRYQTDDSGVSQGGV